MFLDCCSVQPILLVQRRLGLYSSSRLIRQFPYTVLSGENPEARQSPFLGDSKNANAWLRKSSPVPRAGPGLQLKEAVLVVQRSENDPLSI